MQKRAILLGAFCFGALVALALFLAFDADDFSALDTFAGNLAHPYQTLFGAQLFLVITVFGSVTAGLCSLLLAMVFFRHESGIVVRYASALAGSALLATLLKNSFDRVRPASLEWVMSQHTYSFPSGHATTAMVVFGFFGFIAYRRTTGAARTIVLIFFPLAILLIGASRIVLGYHFASDVFAGFFLGGFSLACAFFYPLSSRERRFLRF